jgi:predicted RNA binding protein YcfA (HicA-like mRNA interferase family)
MPKLPGVPHLAAIRALQKAGFRIIRQGRRVVLSDGQRILTIPRHNPVNAITMAGIVRDAGLTWSGFGSCCSSVVPLSGFRILTTLTSSACGNL